jgi:hypothetical protein
MPIRGTNVVRVEGRIAARGVEDALDRADAARSADRIIAAGSARAA